MTSDQVLARRMKQPSRLGSTEKGARHDEHREATYLQCIDINQSLSSPIAMSFTSLAGSMPKCFRRHLGTNIVGAAGWP